MPSTLLPIDEFRELIHPLIGLTVSLPWKGYGSAIFLELGSLAPHQSEHRSYPKGEACIAVHWDWRVEKETSVLYGSSNSGPQIEAGILSLQGTTVQALSVVGQVPELVVQFSNGQSLCSMVMVTGNPEWSIKLFDRRWIHAAKGQLVVGTSDASPLQEDELAVFERAERAAARWGVPNVEPQQGSCTDCEFFVPLDGNGHLLDYGACSAETSPLDGRVVERTSGCPVFTPMGSNPSFQRTATLPLN